MAKRNWFSNPEGAAKGFAGLLENPAFTMGMALMQQRQTGQPIASSVMNGLSQAYGAQKERKKSENAEEDRARRMAYEDEQRARQTQEDDMKRQQIAGFENLLQPQQQIAQSQSPIDTRTARLGDPGMPDFLQSPGTMSTDLLQPPQEMSRTDQMALNMARGGDVRGAYSILAGAESQDRDDRNQIAQNKMQMDMQNDRQDFKQKLFDERAALDSQRYAQEQKAKAEIQAQNLAAKKQEIAQKDASFARREMFKSGIKDQREEKAKKAQQKKSYAKIQQSEKSLNNLLFSKNFDDATGLIQGPMARFSPLQTKDKTTAAKATRMARGAVLDVLASSSLGQINESEMVFAKEKVPSEMSHHDVWIDWYNDEYLPNRNKVTVDAGGEAVGEIEYDEKLSRIVRKKKKAAQRSQKGSLSWSTSGGGF